MAGWYPDPSGQPGERFWNGTEWTQQTRPTPAAPAAVPADAPQAYDGFGNPNPTPVPGQQPPAYGTQPYGTSPYGGAPTYGTPPAQPYGSPPPFATGGYGQPAAGPKPTFWARNTMSLATIGVTVLYVLILVFAHFAILGILPLLLGVRAVGRKEPLAVAAVVIGIAALVLGIYEFSR